MYSNDFMSEANANIYWYSGSSDEVYMYLKNIDSGYNRNTNAEVKLYSKDAFGGYTYQMKAREEGVPLGDKVELYSVKSWYNNENFRGYYYYTWISNGAHSLYSEGY